MRRDEAIEYLENLITQDKDLNNTQKQYARNYSEIAVFRGELPRKEAKLKDYFDFIKWRILND